jgi:thiamine-phosphate pyrophosphorylase
VAGCRLYLVTPPVLTLEFADDLAAALDAGDVACVQLRLKNLPDNEIRHAVETLRPVAQSRDVAFLLNDRPDLAAQSGCDGVHVGQEDMPYAAARALVGNGMIGVTCHNSRHLAVGAAEAGADYVAFGAFYPTLTKQPPAMAEIDTIAWWAEMMEVPCVAIGGITAANCAPLVEAGADFLAVVGAVWQHPDGAAAGVRAMLAAIKAAS